MGESCAAAHAREVSRAHGLEHPLPGWVDVTVLNYPRLHEAFSTISHDVGFGADHDAYCVPPEWVPRLPETEQALSLLDAEEFEAFCIGDGDDIAEMTERSTELRRTDELLSAFLEDWGNVPW